MVRVTSNLTSAAHVRIANPHPCIVALSAPIPHSAVASVLLMHTEDYHCIIWRLVDIAHALSSYSCCTQYWQNGFFNRTSLHSLGFVCHLGHHGNPCPIRSAPHNLTIININGWHKVRVAFCTCDATISWSDRYRQLLCMRWYPASFNRPRTAFSFDLLETYHKLTLQGKLNLYDFYLAIMQKSDNQGRLKTMVSN